MILVGMFFNPMNALLHTYEDFYISLTLFYGGLLMASNMIWAHEIIHYYIHSTINVVNVAIGLSMSLTIVFLMLRNQFYVNDVQWVKRMIGHHSTAITTSEHIYNKTIDPQIKNLAKQIIDNQTYEIKLMKSILDK